MYRCNKYITVDSPTRWGSMLLKWRPVETGTWIAGASPPAEPVRSNRWCSLDQFTCWIETWHAHPKTWVLIKCCFFNIKVLFFFKIMRRVITFWVYSLSIIVTRLWWPNHWDPKIMILDMAFPPRQHGRPKRKMFASSGGARDLPPTILKFHTR